MKFEKALVTGGAGFIGSHLVEELVKNNVKVLVVDNLLTGKKSNIDKLENVVAISVSYTHLTLPTIYSV